MKANPVTMASVRVIAPPLSRVIAYGALGLPLAMAALPVYVHVPRLYAETAGISLSALGALLLIARLADAGIDPLLGMWSDRARRRQHLILLALPLLAAGMFALLHPPASGASGWLMASLLLTYFGFSLASVAYQSWGADLGGDSNQRTRLTASREGFGLLGVVLAASLPAVVSSELSGGLSLLAWLFLPVVLLAGLLTVFGSPGETSRASPTVKSSGNEGVFVALWQVLDDHRFRRLLLVFVVNGVAAALPATLVLFFVADVLQAESSSGAFLALYFISGVACLPLWVAMSRRFGRVAAWVVSMLVAVAAFSWAWLLGAGDVWAFAIVCLLSGAALGADLTLPAALLADMAQPSAEAGVGRSDARQAGSYFGWWNLVAKLNLALAAGLALPLLDVLGYQPGGGGDTAGLSAVYGLAPLFFKLLAAGLAWRWRRELENN